jgi:magnesium chelatase subunit D
VNPAAAARWADAECAALLLATDPLGAGGISLRAGAGPVRDRWLAQWRALLPPGMPLRRLPLHAGDERVLGGLDLAATLSTGRPVAQRGLLAETDGGVVLLSMAERMERGAAARLTAVMDAGAVTLQRDGLSLREPARIGVVALDEGAADDERPPAALLDRLAYRIDLTEVGVRDTAEFSCDAAQVAVARAGLERVRIEPVLLEALCAAALALGVASTRAMLLAARVARTAAALAGRESVSTEDSALAARLVLAPRATRLPAPEPEAKEEQEADAPKERESRPADAPQSESGPEDAGEQEAAGNPAEVVLEAARAAIPAGLLAQLRDSPAGAQAGSAGRAGTLAREARRGRPAGVRRGAPRPGARLNIIETLRAAAPWQRLRQGAAGPAGAPAAPRAGFRVQVRAEDFRVTRFKQRAARTTIFAVDASGSAALHRLAEAKGAVELLLAECYVRRDRVALLAFRGLGTDLLLPPTRSLARARRSLSALPGGGGTPLAAGIDAAAALAASVQRAGEQASVVFLTDGRANVARDGAGSRPRAAEDALAAARRLRAAGVSALLVDTSPRPEPLARTLAETMRAAYVPLPYAGAAALAGAVLAATPREPRTR